ncbi:hypothetical protein SDC9_46147 [bioreactor metagenome]|uniref:Coenzyme PQQ synthesis protein E n=1 Tax=bioreactor metagenome TaxID=1076179 RepID=A0A644W805_9ZZZZ
MKSKSSQNCKLNLLEYKGQKIILESYPQYVMVELTRSCNLRCPMCRDSNDLYKSQNMTNKIFEKVRNELFDKAKLIDIRGWGESLILSNIVEIIESIAKKGTKIRVVTNLSYNKNNVFEVLAKYNCMVAVSIDSVDVDILKKIRGGANLNLISKNLYQLSNLYKFYNGNTKNLSFITTIQYPALSTLHKIIPFAAKFHIPEITFFPVDIDDNSMLSIEGKEEEVEEMLKQVSNLAKEYNINVILGSSIGCYNSNNQKNEVCIHPWSYCYITYDGKVGFCDHLIGPAFDKMLIGDLELNSFNEIWNSHRWQTLRYYHLNDRKNLQKEFYQCLWCYENKYIDFENLFDSKLEKLKLT